MGLVISLFTTCDNFLHVFTRPLHLVTIQCVGLPKYLNNQLRFYKMKALTTILVMGICLNTMGQKMSSIKLRSYSKPIVKAEINGKKAYFLIDTGSSISIINASELGKFDIKELSKMDRKKAVGFNGDREWIQLVTNAKTTFGDLFEYRKFYSMNLDHIVKSIYAETQIRIVGIIGADFLQRHNCVIDYGKNNLIMLDKRSYKKFIASNFE